MEKLKELFRPDRVRLIAEKIRAAHPPFPEKEFLAAVLPNLKDHELKGRVKLVAEALGKCLPHDCRKSFPILLRSIHSPANPQGLKGFQAWPLTQYVENHGLDHPELALKTLGQLTEVMSAEFAVRPFLLRHEELSLKTLLEWAKHKNVHLRRLASEGTRPRLPWGQRLPRFQRDPMLCLEILRQLRFDPELYVRKSVANHLNDFSKDHPDWLVAELTAWKKECGEHPGVNWIVRHATRTLVKAGHPGALALLGYLPAKVEDAKLLLKPRAIKIGGSIEIEFSAFAKKKENWLIDYAVHHRKHNGGTKPKVFKWTKIAVEPGEKISLRKFHKIVPISTRKYYAGSHEVEILVNGASVARATFSLRA